jgi:hypothetical protein
MSGRDVEDMRRGLVVASLAHSCAWCDRPRARVGRVPEPLAPKFWGRVSIQQDSECWEWIAARSPNGYGVISIHRRGHRTHRIAYELAIGAIPIGMLVCHHCDNPPCCNPAHLFLGTNADNTGDMLRKCRAPAMKLRPEMVRRARRLVAGGMSRRNVGALLGVDSSCITRIWLGEAWAWVRPEEERSDV